MTKRTKHTFHGSRSHQIDSNVLNGSGWRPGLRKTTIVQSRDLEYQFYLHSHPYILELVQRLVRQSISGLQSIDTESTNTTENTPKNSEYILYEDFFQEAYQPNNKLIDSNHPVKDLDFSVSGAYSAYNWELFFHIPITVAIHLSKNQRFEEAQQWFHYIFDPTDDSDGPTPERFWKVKPFQTTDVESVERILVNLQTQEDSKLLEDTLASINAWKNRPFQPHVVSRYRQTAYMMKTVMAYLDNLLDWGDSLFQQDTVESINEATQVYVMAANILGRRPQAIP
mgnify:CR=1 FL=1